MTLRNETCVAIRADSLRATDDEVAELRAQVADWQLTDADGIKRLERKYRFRNFAGALAFAGHVGEAAEAEGHHPRLTLEWGGVGVEWWTHTVKGLHRNDFIMAAKSDEIYSRTQREPA